MMRDGTYDTLEILRRSAGLMSSNTRKKTCKREGYTEIEGEIPILLTAPHAQPPQSDLCTGLIARLVAEKSGCHALIAEISRVKVDLNTSKGLNHPFRKRIDELVNKGVKYILDIHGSKKEPPRLQIELGTASFRTARRETIDLINAALKKYGFEVGTDTFLKGEKAKGNIIQTHSNLEQGIECVQIEIRRDLRDPSNVPLFKNTIAALTDIIAVLTETIAPQSVRKDVRKSRRARTATRAHYPCIRELWKLSFNACYGRLFRK